MGREGKNFKKVEFLKNEELFEELSFGEKLKNSEHKL